MVILSTDIILVCKCDHYTANSQVKGSPQIIIMTIINNHTISVFDNSVIFMCDDTVVPAGPVLANCDQSTKYDTHLTSQLILT